MKLAILCAIFWGISLLPGLQTLRVASAQDLRGRPDASASCSAANGGGPNSTNFYGAGNPCAFRYNVPQEKLNLLLNEVGYCSMYSRTQVNCSQPLRGNYGQVPLDANGKAPARVDKPQVSAEQLWQRAVGLIDRNDYRDALPLLTQAGKMGHAKAQATLGIAYQDGSGVRVDDRAAAYWFGLASAQGHRAAQYALGAMYEEGEGGLERDRKKATDLYLASARQGFDKAELMVGLDYLTGHGGLPNDRRQALGWLQMAAAQGSDYARSLTIVLADRSAPAQFADINALGRYLLKLNQEEMARVAAAGNRYSYQQDSNVVARINAAREHNEWLAERGAGNGGNPAP